MIPVAVLNRLKKQAQQRHEKLVLNVPPTKQDIVTTAPVAIEEKVPTITVIETFKVGQELAEEPSSAVVDSIPEPATVPEMTKKEIMKALTEAGITFDKYRTRAELLELLPTND